MTDWNAVQYLKFENQRTQPAIDLANRIRACSPATALDIGCGPGNSTNILAQVFPRARITGIDSSPDMIEKASAKYPQLAFRLCDVNALEGRYDLLFSNACLQWVPDHARLLPRLMKENLNEGGVLAVQVPMNGAEPLFRAIRETASNPKWGFSEKKQGTNGTLTPEEYFDILTACSSAFQIWETTYYHNLPDHRALLEWVKGTRLRPYLAQLNSEQGAAFEAEILEKAKVLYPVTASGEVLLRFRRFFFTAVR